MSDASSRNILSPKIRAERERLIPLIRETTDSRPFSQEKYAQIAAQTEAGVKINRENVVDIWSKVLEREKLQGHPFWLETGVLSDSVQGRWTLRILDRHLKDFEQQEFGCAQIVDLLVAATQTGEVVGHQRSKKRKGRPIFAVVGGDDETIKIAVSYGTHEFIVGASPVSRKAVDPTTALDDETSGPGALESAKLVFSPVLTRTLKESDFSHNAYPSSSVTSYTLSPASERRTTPLV